MTPRRTAVLATSMFLLSGCSLMVSEFQDPSIDMPAGCKLVNDEPDCSERTTTTDPLASTTTVLGDGGVIEITAVIPIDPSSTLPLAPTSSLGG
jgi:hypothetical protein